MEVNFFVAELIG